MTNQLDVNVYLEILKKKKLLSINQLEHMIKIVKEILSKEPNMPNV